jgi:hypothetical protein
MHFSILSWNSIARAPLAQRTAANARLRSFAHECVILAPSISTANPGFGPPHREVVRDTAYEKAFRTMNAMSARLISA